MTKAFIDALRIGDAVDSLFSVKYKRAVTQYANGWRFALGVADKTGELEVSYWGAPATKREAVQALYGSFKEGEVVRVQGLVSVWNDKKKIDINEGKGGVSVARIYDLSDFLPVTEKDVEEMYAQLLELVDSVEHPGLKKLLDAFFRDPTFAAAFKRAPGAMQLHHAWVGGLLEHSLAVAQVARAASKGYDVDIDLLTAGALLHDVGKMKEYEVTTSIKVGEEGMLRGHVVMGEEMVRQKAVDVNLDPLATMKLSHILLSHHGEHEHGAPKKPMFVEAVLVYYADEMDAKASQFARIRKETTTEDFRVYDRHWGEVYLR